MIGQKSAFQIFILNIPVLKTTKRNQKSSRTIPGTCKYHSFVPVLKDKVKVSFYFSSVISKEEMVTVAHNGLSLESIRGFVTCISDGKWWLGCVIEIFQEENSAKLAFLHPHGPSNTLNTLPLQIFTFIASHQGWDKALSNSLSLKHKHPKFFKHKHYPGIHDLS